MRSTSRVAADCCIDSSRGRTVAIKPFLLAGETVVGVGNIYASESLFRARIRPTTAAGRIALPRYVALAAAIRETLDGRDRERRQHAARLRRRRRRCRLLPAGLFRLRPHRRSRAASARRRSVRSGRGSDRRSSALAASVDHVGVVRRPPVARAGDGRLTPARPLSPPLRQAGFHPSFRAMPWLATALCWPASRPVQTASPGGSVGVLRMRPSSQVVSRPPCTASSRNFRNTAPGASS